jgi:hypothetical protein
MFSTDTRGYNEDEKKWYPSAILVPAEHQEKAAVVSDEADEARQLRTLSPQKDTYSLMRLEIIETQRPHLLTKRVIIEMITIPMLNKV